MKLDLFNRQWIDIVFEGRNKAYGAYELRKDDSKTTFRALIIGALVFAVAVSAPLIYNLIPDMSNNDEALDQKIVTIKLPPKELPKDIPPPPPPPPKVDQVKFVKPVVAKTEEIVEEPPKVEEIKDKKLGAETIKGDENAPLTVEPVGTGPSVVEEDNTIYNSAGIQVPAEYPGGVDKFRKCVFNNFSVPDEEEGLSGKIFISFVVEKDGSLTDLKVLRDIGHGTGKEAIKAIKSCNVKWNPGEQNGKKVRMLFMLPINIQTQ
ncbi:MAG: energy transducer TonB [Bacteroidota bacterium]